ncbi:hypothetical protein Dred_2218 [Desulforamulus reducens MI-1]|uniref:Uncharacterized protein n=2 Tax=Desulforamulus TaxID=2916693 RepID=A4J6M9_DESRM|nr:hypothetical protein Dred_2218 [Desulforamulus reducens MI-1]
MTKMSYNKFNGYIPIIITRGVSIMPRRDGTGPMGLGRGNGNGNGRGKGRGMGLCNTMKAGAGLGRGLGRGRGFCRTTFGNAIDPDKKDNA